MPRLTDEAARLLQEPNFATVATLNPDGSSQLSIVWIDWDGKDVLFNTAAGRAKPRNLERDPRLSVLVVDRQDGYRWVGVRGIAEMTTDGADEHIDKLAKKYLGLDEYPYRAPDERRVIIRIRPERVFSFGVDA